MSVVLLIFAILGTVALAAWVVLVLFRGWFWRTDRKLSVEAIEETPRIKVLDSGYDVRREYRLEFSRADENAFFGAATLPKWPTMSVIVPARNEASVLPETLPSLLTQDYPGAFHVFVVDDQSTDGTADAALPPSSST